jgi:hypothetical protein
MRGMMLRAALCLSAGVGAGSAAAQQGWEFSLTPYGWLSGLEGDVGSIPGLPASSVDLSFGDILEDLDYAFMMIASARNGPWVVYFDGTAVQTTSEENVGGALVDKVKIRSKTDTLALSVGRVLAESPRGNVDAYLGARFWWLENTFTVKTAGGSRESTEKANWADPIVGVSGRYRAADRWTLFGSAEVGGFGVGADFEWSVLAGARYEVSDLWGVSFGWRHLQVDYDKDGIVFDVTQTGPVIGATFRF